MVPCTIVVHVNTNDQKHDFQDAYLAGLIDGKGSFAIQQNAGGFAPVFSLSMRADDTRILLNLQRLYGGRIRWRPASGNRSPVAGWWIYKKEDLQSLVGYLDQHQLRTRQARAYHYWRRAVVAYCDSSSASPQLGVLRSALLDLRRYDGSEESELRTASGY